MDKNIKRSPTRMSLLAISLNDRCVFSTFYQRRISITFLFFDQMMFSVRFPKESTVRRSNSSFSTRLFDIPMKYNVIYRRRKAQVITREICIRFRTLSILELLQYTLAAKMSIILFSHAMHIQLIMHIIQLTIQINKQTHTHTHTSYYYYDIHLIIHTVVDELISILE